MPVVEGLHWSYEIIVHSIINRCLIEDHNSVLGHVLNFRAGLLSTTIRSFDFVWSVSQYKTSTKKVTNRELC
jgi:hypothetical protein